MPPSRRDGKNSFYFNGQPIAPTLRLFPGDRLKITYVNDLPAKPQESCAITPCMDMTNLHFHGLTVSPDAPQDDVLDMMAKPGQSLHYTVQIPKDHPPGLYWYHTHPHGESHRQVLDGMSGALVIEGIEAYVPELAGLSERILIVRGRSIENDPDAANLKQSVALNSYDCGGEPEAPEEIFTVNGSVRPRIEIAPGERQFWRLVNASADRYSTCNWRVSNLRSSQWMVCRSPSTTPSIKRAAPSMFHCPRRAGWKQLSLVRRQRTPRRLISRCVDTGPDGDPNPAMVLADLVPKPAPRLRHPKLQGVPSLPDLKTTRPRCGSERRRRDSR